MFERNNSGIGAYMPVQPYGYGGGGGLLGGLGGGSDIWAILFILALFGGGWGGFGGFGWGGMNMMGMMGGMGMDYLYPWLSQSREISGGFRDQMISNKLDSISAAQGAGFSQLQLGQSGLARDICVTGNGITAAVTGGFAAAESAENARQMALLQQLFGIQSTQLESGCENRAAIADVKYAIATEAANTRASASADSQKIMDKLCQLELDGVRQRLEASERDSANLRNEVMYYREQASRETQSNNIVSRILTEMRQCPVPSQPVYGNTPIFSCNGNNPSLNNGGCGCGGNYAGYAYAG